ncbi:type II/IV secretion system protein [Pandoraea fibrosis]|uniref:Type II/IV secretion system protein n=1 Tax=Pandoraea fibrosis TaxID=1891094 RepID=A0ABX6HN46_9BURK|nr:GspE/PulE family protein [Pandoraea fibrosis]QHE94130.1 type II/IV secretion system protein [Pandoraea fibrosis]QHF12306.1 type II/IV secretion system protein [Pandoraea fibrosis]
MSFRTPEHASASADTAPLTDHRESAATELRAGHGAATPLQLLEQMLSEAIRAGASDVHFEPMAQRFRIRLRIDGRLQEHRDVPMPWRDMLISRLKVLANLDIAQKRLPQDGRMIWREAGEPVECRVSALPTLHGEKLVVRLLDGAKVPLSLEGLGYTPQQYLALARAIAQPHGMILLTGPTGSGKTVSLYSCLRRLNDTSRNIVTIEDPVEIRLPGITQVNLNERAGLDFATALRAFLRQDPDVLVVGEIRDPQTAEIAVQAAQTGHLVFATVHANDAPSTLARLFDLGVAPFNLSSTLLIISAQRLLRRRCPAGCEPHAAPRAPSPAGHRCMRCHGTGFAGRIGAFQVMPISATQAINIAQARSPHELAAQARSEGVMTLREAGLWHAAAGTVSKEDVDATTPA